jgi:DNA-directed RNA polymerase
LYIVASQLNTLIADGIDTLNVSRLKITVASADWPLTNMWWPQTRKPSRAMAMLL